MFKKLIKNKNIMAKRELIGKIIIQENIDTVDANKIDKTFVINVPDPYKSYYTRFTDVEKPTSIIFVTKQPNSFEKILRVTQKINKEHNLDITGAKCEVKIGSRKLSGVRVKGINRYTEIIAVQEHYKNEGFEFAKSEKFKDTDSIIRINRFFNIEELEDGIFESQMEDNTYYVQVPKFMNWDDFRKHTFDIKNNVKDRNYDIAKGILYDKTGIVEMLRIVKPKATVEFLKSIQKKYTDKLQ